MDTHCEVTGRTPGSGRPLSHSHRRTDRRLDPDARRRLGAGRGMR